MNPDEISERELWENNYSVFISTVSVLAMPALEQCNIMDNYNVAWELRYDGLDVDYLLKQDIIYFTDDQKEVMHRLSISLNALNYESWICGAKKEIGLTSHRCQFGCRSRLVPAHESRPPASWQAGSVRRMRKNPDEIYRNPCPSPDAAHVAGGIDVRQDEHDPYPYWRGSLREIRRDRRAAELDQRRKRKGRSSAAHPDHGGVRSDDPHADVVSSKSL